MRTWWLSFCDPTRSKGQQFVGVAIIEATTLRAAISRAWQTGCNPGGEISSLAIPEDKLDTVADVPRDTLMDRAEIERRGLTS